MGRYVWGGGREMCGAAAWMHTATGAEEVGARARAAGGGAPWPGCIGPPAGYVWYGRSTYGWRLDPHGYRHKRSWRRCSRDTWRLRWQRARRYPRSLWSSGAWHSKGGGGCWCWCLVKARVRARVGVRERGGGKGWGAGEGQGLGLGIWAGRWHDAMHDAMHDVVHDVLSGRRLATRLARMRTCSSMAQPRVGVRRRRAGRRRKREQRRRREPGRK